MQLGGWNSVKALQPYLVIPEEVMARVFGSKGLIASFDTEATAPPAPPCRVNHARETIAGAASSEEIRPADLSERELAYEVAQVFSDGVLDADDIAASGRSPDADTESRQASFSQFGADDQAVTGPAAITQTAKVAYLSYLAYVAWALSFGTVV